MESMKISSIFKYYMLVKFFDKLLKKFFIDFTWFISYFNKNVESVESVENVKSVERWKVWKVV